jgi:hypothetical protein
MLAKGCGRFYDAFYFVFFSLLVKGLLRRRSLLAEAFHLAITLLFGLRANQFGAVPTEENYVNVGGQRMWNIEREKRWIGVLGLQARLNLGDTKADLLVQEAYLKGKWGIFELSAGRKKYIQGLMDSTLSSGSFVYSLEMHYLCLK